MTWDCATGTPEEDHDWQYVADWFGDAGVIGGTCDFYFKKCRQCGKEIEISANEMPSFEDDY